MGRPILAALPLALLAAATGTVDLFDADGRRVGSLHEKAGGRVDVFDAESRRTGWGRVNRDGSVELFDMKGNRISTLTRDREAFRMERPRR